MKILILALLFLIAERALPYGAWGYMGHSSPHSEADFIKRYGLFSFPRAYFAVGSILFGGASYLFSQAQFFTDVASFVLMAIYIGFAGMDVFRAAR